MLYIGQAVAAMVRISRGSAPSAVVQRRELLIAPGTTIPVEIYSRPGEGKSRGTILFIHGFTVHGFRDSLGIKWCSILSLTGFTIVSAHYAELASYRIDPDTIDRIACTIRALHECPDICSPGRRVGVLAVSISGGMALVAASRPAARDGVSAVCSIAGIYDLEAEMEYLLGGLDEDHFACRLILLNFLRHSLPRPQVEQALRVALEDRGYKRAEPQLPAFLAALDPGDREIFFRLHNDPAYRLHHFRLFKPKIQHLIAVLSEIDSVQVPVVLIHGATDTIVPATQSVRAYERLRRRGVPVRLEISRLLDHHRPRAGLLQIGAAVRLIRVFGHFLKQAAR